MARKVSETLVDDIDGGKAAETVKFGIDGIDYEIDLSKKNADRLRSSLVSYVSASRKLVRTTGRGGRRSRTVVQRRIDVAADPRAVRAWAKSNKIAVPDRGRIPGTVLEAYRAAGH
jgi:hypothetical protein